MVPILIVVGVVKSWFDPAKSDHDGLLPPIEVHLSGTATGPCSVLSTVVGGDVEDDVGRKVGDVFFWDDPQQAATGDDSCIVEFDTATKDGVPRLPRYVIRFGDLYAAVSVPDDAPGNVGDFVLIERTRS